MVDQAKRHLRRIERPIEPNLPIIDPHHHFWPSAGGTEPFLHPRYLLDDLLADMRTGHDVIATVFLNCAAARRTTGPEHLACVGETEFVNAIAEEAARRPDNHIDVAAGIVGSADLTLGAEVGEVLDAHLEAAPLRFRGVRFGLFWHEDREIHNPDLNPEPRIHDPRIREGANELARRNLSFESWVYHTQLAALAEFAGALPDLTIILNHLGGPIGAGRYATQRDEVFADWSRGMQALSAHPNVVVKLGGINMWTNGYDWDALDYYPDSAEIAEKTRRYYLQAIELFGAERCMFESNFPMESVAYPTLWNVFKRISAGFSSAEKAALFHDTAARVYRLGRSGRSARPTSR